MEREPIQVALPPREQLDDFTSQELPEIVGGDIFGIRRHLPELSFSENITPAPNEYLGVPEEHIVITEPKTEKKDHILIRAAKYVGEKIERKIGEFVQEKGENRLQKLLEDPSAHPLAIQAELFRIYQTATAGKIREALVNGKNITQTGLIIGEHAGWPFTVIHNPIVDWIPVFRGLPILVSSLCCIFLFNIPNAIQAFSELRVSKGIRYLGFSAANILLFFVPYVFNSYVWELAERPIEHETKKKFTDHIVAVMQHPENFKPEEYDAFMNAVKNLIEAREKRGINPEEKLSEHKEEAEVKHAQNQQMVDLYEQTLANDQTVTGKFVWNIPLIYHRHHVKSAQEKVEMIEAINKLLEEYHRQQGIIGSKEPKYNT